MATGASEKLAQKGLRGNRDRLAAGTRVPRVRMGGSRPVATVVRGGKLSVTMTVKDAEGKPVEALLPAEIRLYDGAGREIDGAGWVCLQGGTCTIEFVTNINDAAGDYRVVCRDRASGLSAERTIKVNLKTDAT